MNRIGGRVLFLAGLLVGLPVGAGCDNTSAPPDGGGDEGGCRSAVECSDGVFCNGVELCDPSHPAADAMGCLPGPAPCLASQTCNETSAACESDCAVAPDADGDGSESILCGGDDCDDSRADRFPGNTEVCDAEGIDEDCDPATLGADADGDGEVGSQCCNLTGGVLRCGNDCDDSRASVVPGATEVCNGIDEDCDGTLDEGVLTLAYPDFDGDGFGNGRAGRERECDGDPLFAAVAGDCDDSNPDVNPDATEVCDGVDNDCDGDASDEIDIDRDGYFDAASTCEGLTTPDCDDLNPTTFPGAPEQCNDLDDNCNGTIDERDGAAGSDIQCNSRIGDATGFCADLGTRHACVVSACPADRADCDGNPANGCEIDLATNSAHCGGCGVRCDGACVDGLCETPPAGAVLDIAMGRSGGCVLREETPGSGQGWLGCWGEIWFVPLGSHPTPVLRADGTRVDDAVSVAASRNGMFYIDASGRLFGVGESDVTPEAQEITVVPAPVAEVSTGPYGTCARTQANVLYCWGDDDDYPWGSSAPTVRFPGESFQQVSVGDTHACALDTSDRVVCWGRNDRRQLGIGDDDDSAGTALLGTYRRVAAGDQFTCAERTTGGVVCWGYDNLESDDIEYLGSGLMVHELVAGSGFGCAINDGGRVRCFGTDATGSAEGLVCGSALSGRSADSCDDQIPLATGEQMQCMSGECRRPGASDARSVRTTEYDEVASHARPRLLQGASDLAVNERSMCAVVDERVVCWGADEEGQLAVSEFIDVVRVAHQQRRSARVAQIHRGRDGTCARRTDGSLACWGLDNAGQLGLPAGVYLSPRESDGAPRGLRSVSVGEIVSCGVRTDGTAVCWGGVGAEAGAIVPLGDGSAHGTGSATPVTVSGLSGVRAISVAYQHACALVGNGEVHCWGDNGGGALGPSASDDCGGRACALAPVRVTLPAAAAQVVTAGLRVGDNSLLDLGHYTCARLVDGRVFCWGDSPLGGLGQGATFQSTTPLEVVGIEGAVDVAASSSHACALGADGRARCWGADLEGTASGGEVCALGIRCHTAPFDVPVLDNGVDIEVGLALSCALREGGDVSCWGPNAQGEAGDGTRAPRPVPASVVVLPAPARSIEVRGQANCATLVTDEAYCWGYDEAGQVGDGPLRVHVDDPRRILPQEVPGL